MNVRSYEVYAGPELWSTPRPTPRLYSTHLMRPRKHSAIRALTALCLILGFSLFTTESLIAEVHDGDADTGHVASVESTGAHHDGAIPTDGPDRPPHAAHVCHCVHAHAGVTSPRQSLSVVEPGRSSAPIDLARSLASIDREPQLRPPIA